MSDFIFNSLKEAEQTITNFIQDKNNLIIMEKCIEQFSSCFKNDGRVYSCGNGGSMADAIHFAEELSGKFRSPRRPLPAQAISDPGHLSCIANDYGYEYVFSKYIEAFGRKGDCLLAISTSGQSNNILKAVEIGKQKGMHIIALTGKDGGKLKELSDLSIIVKANCADRIQEVHIKIIHTFIEGIERNLFPENYE